MTAPDDGDRTQARPRSGPRRRRAVDSPLTPGSPAARAGRTRAVVATVTGVLLLGFVLPVLVLPGGPAGLDWNRLAARWSSPLWWVWDLALVLAVCGWAGLQLVERRRRGAGLLVPAGLAALTLALAVCAVTAVVSLGHAYR